MVAFHNVALCSQTCAQINKRQKNLRSGNVFTPQIYTMST